MGSLAVARVGSFGDGMSPPLRRCEVMAARGHGWHGSSRGGPSPVDLVMAVADLVMVVAD